MTSFPLYRNHIKSGSLGINITYSQDTARAVSLQCIIPIDGVRTKTDRPKPPFTRDSTLPFRRNAIASPDYPNDFAKFAPDSYFPQNAAASKIEIEIQNQPTIV